MNTAAYRAYPIITVGGFTFHCAHDDAAPPQTPKQRASLKADMRRRGMVTSIIGVWDESKRIVVVIDGATRVSIAAELEAEGVPVSIHWTPPRLPDGKTWFDLSEEERRETAWRVNFERRHLTREDRARWILLLRAQGKSTREVGAIVDCDPKTVLNVERAAGVEDSTPITDRRGREQPRRKPRPPKAAPPNKDADSASLQPPAPEPTREREAPGPERARGGHHHHPRCGTSTREMGLPAVSTHRAPPEQPTDDAATTEKLILGLAPPEDAPNPALEEYPKWEPLPSFAAAGETAIAAGKRARDLVDDALEADTPRDAEALYLKAVDAHREAIAALRGAVLSGAVQRTPAGRAA